MGPEEHGGHCELVFDGLEVADENVLMGLGDGLRITQIRLGPARLTHCMRWLGLAKRCCEIAQAYVNEREGFGVKLADRESVQIKLGDVAHRIQIGRLLVMHAAWLLDQGDRARKEVSMAKVHVADTLHHAADVAIQLNGARGYSKDTVLEWIYRYARQARLVDGADEVHKMVLARHMRDGGPRFLEVGRRGISQCHGTACSRLPARGDPAVRVWRGLRSRLSAMVPRLRPPPSPRWRRGSSRRARGRDRSGSRRAQSPNTYSTVALRCSFSSGVLTSLRRAVWLGPETIATYCLPFDLEGHRRRREAGADVDLPQLLDRGVVIGRDGAVEQREEHESAARRQRAAVVRVGAGARSS